jgi:hypothetical protein
VAGCAAQFQGAHEIGQRKGLAGMIGDEVQNGRNAFYAR